MDAEAAMSNQLEIPVPDLGDFAEVEVVEILVAVGDQVAAEAPLVVLESDKATMEIPSPASGTVSRVVTAIGDKVSAGMAIVVLETRQPVAAEKTGQPDRQPAADPPAAPAPVAAERPAVAPPARTSPPPAPAGGTAAAPHASPGIRRYARQLGADLTQIEGSGSKGRILKQDVKGWVKRQLTDAHSGARSGPGSAIEAIPAIDFSQFGGIETLPLGRIKKRSGPHLQRAWLNIPHVTHHDDADISELERFRQSLKARAEQRGIRVTLLAFALKILAHGLKAFPSFNASLHPDGQHLILKRYFNIGIAVDTEHGLVVPVLREVDKKSVFDLAADMAEVSQRARDGKLLPADLQGGCMTISSLGGIGGSAFTPIVNAPEVAILGIARAKMTPVWDGQAFQPRLMLPLDLSYDHRVIDGAEGARFMAFLVDAFSDIRQLIL